MCPLVVKSERGTLYSLLGERSRRTRAPIQPILKAIRISHGIFPSRLGLASVPERIVRSLAPIQSRSPLRFNPVALVAAVLIRG